MKYVKKFLLLLGILAAFLILQGCMDPEEFERDTQNLPSRQVNVVDTSADLSATRTVSTKSDGLLIEVHKEIAVSPVHRAVGWKDRNKPAVKEPVDIRFVNLDSYTALIVTHYTWDYPVTAEFPVIGSWVETLGELGNTYTNTIRWPDNSNHSLVIKYVDTEVTTISVGDRVFYLKKMPSTKPTINIGSKAIVPREGNRGEHIVKSGETAERIAKKYGLSLVQLKALNPTINNWSVIQPGDGLKIEY